MEKEITREKVVTEIVPEIEEALSPLRVITNLLQYATWEEKLDDPLSLYMTLNNVLKNVSDIIYNL